ncbi:hypothetical protein DPMN_066769 [Dreissena polymorpha]|uniref:G-protein coupled receptors family 1 profile domain-containing protein n=1 Tax=Dreissena polymorpha TaxID=45954 RepID=A0A9D3YZ35_DREPO|nr:hypothetical protein DPMN_066769 [Dreissena polymorpha]
MSSNESISCVKDWGNCSLNNLNQNMPAITQTILSTYTMFLYAIIALRVSGNLIVLFVFIKHKPASTTDWFILFIATCDFFSSAFNVPVYVTFTNTFWAKYGNDVICKLHMFLSQSIVLSSSFLICGLAVDRYLKICKANSIILTSKRARNGCLRGDPCHNSVVNTMFLAVS